MKGDELSSPLGYASKKDRCMRDRSYVSRMNRNVTHAFQIQNKDYKIQRHDVFVWVCLYPNHVFEMVYFEGSVYDVKDNYWACVEGF